MRRGSLRMPGGSVLAWCWAWVVVISRHISSAGVSLFDVARALRHALLIPVMLSGILAAVAMEWWECSLVCACGVVMGWKLRGILQAEASVSKSDSSSSEWASEIGTFLDPQKEVRWRIAVSELSFDCEDQNKHIKAQVCGREVAVQFSEQKIIMGRFEQTGFLHWGKVFDETGNWLRNSTARPLKRV